MKAIIRIKGLVGVRKNLAETLFRLRLRKKYTCIIVKESKELNKIFNKIRNVVAYGDVDEETIKKLVELRSKAVDKSKKVDVKKLSSEIIKEGTQKIKDIKPYFRLHPPRKGIRSKVHYPKGVLGDHGKEINKLIKRML